MRYITCNGQKGLIGPLFLGVGMLASPIAVHAQTPLPADGATFLRQAQDVVPETPGAVDVIPGQNFGAQFNTPAPNAVPVPVAEPFADNRRPVQRTNIRAPVVETGRAPVRQDDPFAPVGIALGSLRLTTYVKQSLGISSNPQNTANGDSGAISLTEINAELRSDWRRHELAVNFNAEYESFFDEEIDANPQFDIDGSLRLDLIDGFAATLGVNYGFENESATSTNLTAASANEPGVHSIGTFAQLERTGYRLGLTLRGSIERTIFDDVQMTDGSIFSQADRDQTTFGLSARGTYQSGLAYNPFVQVGYFNRVFDLDRDRNGQQRASVSYDLRGGLAFDLTEKFGGEISAGYVVQEFNDPALAALGGIVVDANLNWSPQRDSNISLLIGSNLGGSTTAGDGGAITYNAELALNRRIRDNLEVSGGVGIAYTNFEGLGRIDTTYTAQLGFEYWLNRTFSITGDASYENLESSQPGNSYDAAVVMLGVKVQR